jgi:hypothetical protein
MNAGSTGLPSSGIIYSCEESFRRFTIIVVVNGEKEVRHTTADRTLFHCAAFMNRSQGFLSLGAAICFSAADQLLPDLAHPELIEMSDSNVLDITPFRLQS